MCAHTQCLSRACGAESGVELRFHDWQLASLLSSVITVSAQTGSVREHFEPLNSTSLVQTLMTHRLVKREKKKRDDG